MGTTLHWLIFNLFVIAAITFDLKVFHGRPHKISMREASLWSVVWVGISVLFGWGLWRFAGHKPGLEFFTGYLIEKALSVDNLFLFLVIFRAFAVDERIQHRMLEWGILGALVMRGAMIFAGAALVARYSWVMYIFGAFILYAGLHMLFMKEKEVHPEQNALFRFASKHLRVTRHYHGERFFIRDAGRLFATPLFLVLLVVEITDVTLAIDSIPAIFGITKDAFIVYSSNVLAILGLRALYFLMAGMLDRLKYLDEGLAFVLLFIGAKMTLDRWISISTSLSLAIVAGILVLALIPSLLTTSKIPVSRELQSK